MPAILLIRHGENDYVKQGRLAGRLPGVHLNEKGQAQAERLAKALAKVPIKAIYSSPLDRALETAAPLAAVKSLIVVECPGLVETDVGAWQGEKISSLRRLKIWKTLQNRPSLMRFPDGETVAEAQQRIVAEIQHIASLHGPKEMAALFSHSDPIKLAVAYFLGQPLDMFQRLAIAPASVTTLFVGVGQAMLVNLNTLPGDSFAT